MNADVIQRSLHRLQIPWLILDNFRNPFPPFAVWNQRVVYVLVLRGQFLIGQPFAGLTPTVGSRHFERTFAYALFDRGSQFKVGGGGRSIQEPPDDVSGYNLTAGFAGAVQYVNDVSHDGIDRSARDSGLNKRATGFPRIVRGSIDTFLPGDKDAMPLDHLIVGRFVRIGNRSRPTAPLK